MPTTSAYIDRSGVEFHNPCTVEKIMNALAWLLFIVSFANTQQPPQRPQQGSLKVGDPAPAFTLQDAEGKQTVKLADLKGKPVVLIFGSCT